MSILLIGEKDRNRIPITQTKITHIQYNDEGKRHYQLQKELYRQDLLHQMKEKIQKKQKQIIKDKQWDLHTHFILDQHLPIPYGNYCPILHIHNNKLQEDSTQTLITPRQSLKTKLPPLEKQRFNKFAIANPEKEVESSNNFPNFNLNRRRIKTQYEGYEPQSQGANQDEEKFKSQLFEKINQVYSEMSKSIKTLNTGEQYEKIVHKIHSNPIDKATYTPTKATKKRSPAQRRNKRYKNNFYELPSIEKRSIDYQSYHDNSYQDLQNQINWREWYAKKKLEELKEFSHRNNHPSTHFKYQSNQDQLLHNESEYIEQIAHSRHY